MANRWDARMAGMCHSSRMKNCSESVMKKQQGQLEAIAHAELFEDGGEPRVQLYRLKRKAVGNFRVFKTGKHVFDQAKLEASEPERVPATCRAKIEQPRVA